MGFNFLLLNDGDDDDEGDKLFTALALCSLGGESHVLSLLKVTCTFIVP